MATSLRAIMRGNFLCLTVQKRCKVKQEERAREGSRVEGGAEGQRQPADAGLNEARLRS